MRSDWDIDDRGYGISGWVSDFCLALRGVIRNIQQHYGLHVVLYSTIEFRTNLGG